MENTKKQAFIILGGLLSLLLILGLFRLIGSAKSDTNTNFSATKDESISATNPLYLNILRLETIDNFPPNNYFPKNLEPLFNDNFDISVRAYGVMDRDSGELLYAKNLTKELPIASIAKIMTAIVALENAPLDATFAVSPNAGKIGEASMGLSTGERLTAEELLYGAMLPSGNDAAETLAEGVGIYHQMNDNLNVDREKGREWFLDEMNRKAQSLGMMDTYFFNPTGLDEETKEKSSFSTALDFLALANYALNNPTFAKIVETKNITFPYKEGYHKSYNLYNILQLDGSFKGIKGVKPGSSVFANETLVSYLEKDGRRIIAVILGSDFTKDDVVKIYKRIFEK
ncbi:D-alanyl-D-alanine carboxypeptidase [Candidatus Gottesmanbacteria bacterium]|nr:D-alanyl-D-alanine carboxypeptidase [Candidatus Gottesmanbacteria bacterium]